MMRFRSVDYFVTLGLCAVAVFLVVFFAQIGASHAKELPKPTSEILLTVGGNVEITNGDGVAEFDREMLESLGIQSITTKNPFETGMHSFDGVLIRDILNAVQAKGAVLNATAHDGYSVQIPIEDTQKFPVMLAMVWNGKVMKVRNRGPLWVIYPLSDYPELVDQKYSARSVWQLKKLMVE